MSEIAPQNARATASRPLPSEAPEIGNASVVHRQEVQQVAKATDSERAQGKPAAQIKPLPLQQRDTSLKNPPLHEFNKLEKTVQDPKLSPAEKKQLMNQLMKTRDTEIVNILVGKKDLNLNRLVALDLSESKPDPDRVSEALTITGNRMALQLVGLDPGLYTDEELKDPKLMEAFKDVIKEFLTSPDSPLAKEHCQDKLGMSGKGDAHRVWCARAALWHLVNEGQTQAAKSADPVAAAPAPGPVVEDEKNKRKIHFEGPEGEAEKPFVENPELKKLKDEELKAGLTGEKDTVEFQDEDEEGKIFSPFGPKGSQDPGETFIFDVSDEESAWLEEDIASPEERPS